MARVVSMERARVEQLAATLVPELRDHGHVMVPADELDDVERWRAAARRAGRILGWSVRTGVTSDGTHVWAYSHDWPVPPGAHREAVLRVSAMFNLRPPPPRTRPPARRRRP